MHPMLCHLLRSWATIGLAMVLMAAFAALTGCGGGSVGGEARLLGNQGIALSLDALIYIASARSSIELGTP